MNKKLHTIFLCFFLLSNCFLLYAQKQDFFFEKLTEESGRSLGFITGITQDDKGFLWIATRNGLYRYDGYQYKIFRNRPDDTTSLPFNDITYIYKDNSNILWLRHYDRLIAFRDEKVLKNFKPVTSQHYKLNAKIVEDHNNNLWFGPGEDGLYRYDKKTEETFNYHYLPNTYPPELFSQTTDIRKKTKPVVELINIKNNKDTSAHFNIKKNGHFLVISSGEYHHNNLFDKGAVKNNKGETIWETESSKVKYAGGDFKNRLQIAIVSLSEGQYSAHFTTDEFNAFAQWDGSPPEKFEEYGIAIYQITKKKKHSINHLINKIHTPHNYLSCNEFNDLLIDNAGDLCILNKYGIERYIAQKDSFVLHPIAYDSLFNDFTDKDQLTFLQDNKNRFWIGTNRGIIIYNFKKNEKRIIKNISYQNSNIPLNNVLSIFQDNHNNMWIGTTHGIFFKKADNDVFWHYQENNNNRLYNNTIIDFYQDRSKNIWIATSQGLNKFIKSPFLFYDLGIDRYSSFPIVMEKNKDLWYRGKQNTLNHFNRKSRKINSFKIPEKYFVYNNYYNARDFFFNDIYYNSSNKIWISVSNTILTFNTKTNKIEQTIKVPDINLDASSVKNKVHAVALKEKSNQMIIFCINGIYELDSATSKIVNFLPFNHKMNIIEDVDDSFIKHILKDSEGKYWLRTPDGLYCYKPDKHTLQLVHQFDEEIRHTSLVDGNICEDKDHNIWIAFMPKLLKISSLNKKEIFTCEQSSDVGICNIYAGDTSMWIYTQNGLFRYHKKKNTFNHYTYNDGLVDNNINYITEGHRNNLWITSIKGLSKFSITEKTFNNYFRSFDIKSYSFRKPYYRFEQPDNEILFFTPKGFLSFYPDSFNRIKPKIVITDLKLFGKSYITDSLIYNKSRIDLRYNQNFLTFTFAALDYTKPEENDYAYLLKGLDKKWKYCNANSRNAYYTNIPPGEYEFIVKASNNDKVWNEKGISLLIVIHPPWYKTTVAYISYVILFILFFYLFIKIREKRLLREKQILEQKVEERTQTIQKQNKEITAQRDKIVKQNQDIKDSILYASRIQKAILPPDELIKQYIPESFIFFKPRDIVSGDFYYLNEKNGSIIVVAADCTGHGVPGAFMSMLGTAVFNDVINNNEQLNADSILNQVKEGIINALHQTGKTGESRDGMDLALYIIHPDKKQIEFAGANNPLIIVRNGEILTYKGDRMPVGIHEDKTKSFTKHVIDVEENDMLYVFSDGYQDQFGGPRNKKFKIKNLKNLFAEIYKEPVNKQKDILSDKFHNWIEKGKSYQIDDVIVIGVKIKP